MGEDSSIYEEYKKEAEEVLNKMRISCGIIKERSDKHALDEIMKCSHKIKGVAGMMDYLHIAELAGEIESVSKLLVEGKLELKPEVVAILLESTDLLAKYIETDFDERDAILLEKMRRLSRI